MRKMLLLAILFVVGCGKSEPPVTPSKIENVTKVLFMGNGSYAVLTENPETKELIRYHFDSYSSKIKVFADCPSDKKMWVEVLPQEENNTKRFFIIHVRSGDDIGGGTTGGKNSVPINVVK